MQQNNPSFLKLWFPCPSIGSSIAAIHRCDDQTTWRFSANIRQWSTCEDHRSLSSESSKSACCFFAWPISLTLSLLNDASSRSFKWVAIPRASPRRIVTPIIIIIIRILAVVNNSMALRNLISTKHRQPSMEAQSTMMPWWRRAPCRRRMIV